MQVLGTRQVVFCNDGGLRIQKSEREWQYEVIPTEDHDKDRGRIKRESAARLYSNVAIRDLLRSRVTSLVTLFTDKGDLATIDEWAAVLNAPPP